MTKTHAALLRKNWGAVSVLIAAFIIALFSFPHSGYAQIKKLKPIQGTEGLMKDPKMYWKYYEKERNVQEKNGIDSIVFKGVKAHNLVQAPLCDDSVFVRRAYYLLTGFPPSFNEAYTFLKDVTVDKRARLIDKLLDSVEFVDLQTARWADVLRIKSEFPMNLWPNGTMCYYRWVRDAVRTEKPLIDFYREILLGCGSDFRDGPANFYRAVPPPRGPADRASAVARLFLGQHLESFSSQIQEDFILFFSRLQMKKSGEWKEEIIYWDRKPLDKKPTRFPDMSAVTINDDEDPRDALARWLVNKENHQFNYAIVNRIWYWMFGQGIVHEPDDFRPDNQPVYPDLLPFLETELLASNYNLRHMIRLIMNSHVFQQSSIARSGDYAKEEKYFSVFPIRRLDAEALQDTFIKIFKTSVTYKSEVPEPYTFIPDLIRTVSIADAGITNSFLETFGRATRDSGTLADRNNKTSQNQQLFFLNSTELNGWTRKLIDQIREADRNLDKDKKIFFATSEDSVNKGRQQDLLMDIIWMTLLSRRPSVPERTVMRNAFGANKAWTDDNLQDIIWAVVNTKEFLCMH